MRDHGQELLRRLDEPRRFLQVLVGPRQVGKSTLIGQVVRRAGLPHRIASADLPTLRGPEWIEAQWEAARLLVRGAGTRGALLILDEIQKVPRWSDAVKQHWDRDTWQGLPLKVVLLGSAPILVQRGLADSLAGRFETTHIPHWSFAEMRTAFGWSLEQYLCYGGYPGSAPLTENHERWLRYICDSLIETTISRDVLLLSRVDKPALLRRLFELGCAYSGQILSYTKMVGQLQDAGNTTTLAHYLDLLAGAGMVIGLQKYSGQAVRRKGSSPKLQVFNTALMTALADLGPGEALLNREFRGHLVESSVGAHLVNAAAQGKCRVYYWRDGNREVDFVVRSGGRLLGLEVKSGRSPRALSGLAAFQRAHRPDRSLLVGGDGIPVESFLSTPVADWLRP